MRAFPDRSQMRWKRLDVSGEEDACIERSVRGWRLGGRLEVAEGGVIFVLRYDIVCDNQWRTRSAVVDGDAGDKPVRIALASDGEGHWTRAGDPLPEVEGAIDIDFGFSPATNMLPIRRLELGIGQTMPVRSAWLTFPELRLEPLEQTYTRETERSYRYVAQVDGAPFSARLETDEYGRVLSYEGLWKAC